jgi:hypothetical protein
MARGLAVAVVALLVAAGPAAAADKSATCTTLPAVLGTVQSGDTVTLDSSQATGGGGSDNLCHLAVTLPDFDTPGPAESYKSWTLQGRAGMSDGFSGSGVTGRVMTGHDVHRLLLQDLTFRDSHANAPGANGGAVSITGEATLQVFLSEFYGNSANDKGGAVSFAPTFAPDIALNTLSLLGNTFGSPADAALGNDALTGGAVSFQGAGAGEMTLNGNDFGNNVAIENGGAVFFTSGGTDSARQDDNEFVDNRTGGSGGGTHLVDASSVRITNNLYDGNVAGPIPNFQDAPADHFGGGLYIDGSGANPALLDNRFTGNAVEAFQNGQDYGGGGLALFADGVNVQSETNRFDGNTVAGQPDADFESEGGGVFVSNPAGSWYGFLDAVAGNSVGALGEGGGIYVGASATMLLELGEVTVAHNTVGAGGQGAGLAGGGFDDLVVRNSTIWNEPNFSGFDSLDVTYSDMCQNGRGGPVPGEGNICADPMLVSATDVHQTKQSPTIDKGNDAYLEDEGDGERNMEDYEGDPRPTDGDGDGHTVDMGADETPAGFTAQDPPPPPPPASPQCSDQVDNDGDGAIDAADPGCLAGPADDNEGDENLQDVFLCGQRTISLVRADARGRRVVLSGIVARSVAGQKVDLFVRYLGRRGRATKLATVTPGADGQFQARVKGPPRGLFNKARYRATVAGSRSVELKLPQSLASSSLRQVAGGMLELRGQVDRKLLGKRNVVVVKRILCASYTTVGQARPDRRGRYVVRFPAPAGGGSALYRAESRVLARPGSKREVRQFARAIGISF